MTMGTSPKIATLAVIAAMLAGLSCQGSQAPPEHTASSVPPTTGPSVVDACFVRVSTCDVARDAQGRCPRDKLHVQLLPRTDAARRCGCGATNPNGVPCAPGCTPKGIETCNGLDDDCDGMVDNVAGTEVALSDTCAEFAASLVGKGQCRAGTRACVKGAWGKCVGQVGPQPERCDGIDNDCDGFVDNPKPGTAATEAEPLRISCAEATLAAWDCPAYRVCSGGVTKGDECLHDGPSGVVSRKPVAGWARLVSPPPDLTCAAPATSSVPLCPFGAGGETVDEAFLAARFESQRGLPEDKRDRVFFTLQPPASNPPACTGFIK